MAQIYKRISVDVAADNIFQAIVAKQFDTGSRFLTVSLVNEGTALVVNQGSTVIINACRADGDAKAFAGTVNTDGTITVPITSWMLALDDKVKCDISVVDADQTKLTSTMFEINVEEAAYSGSDISQDENYDLLVSLLAEVSDAKTAEIARVAAESARVEAETGRVAAETSRVEAETARASAEQNRVAAWANALGIQEITIEDTTTNKQYVYQIKIVNGKPVLYYDEATE